MTVQFKSDIMVEYLRHTGSDQDIARAAWVLPPEETRERDTPEGWASLIKTMMRARHGTPFEHGSLTVYVHAPIFVFREWHRHRVGWSYNETSGRYSHMEPVFYVPPDDRPMVEPDGFKPMRPHLRAADYKTYREIAGEKKQAHIFAWQSYQRQLARGCAREVARGVLGTGIYSKMHATCNPRSLMHFLSLRVYDARAAHPSFALWEIEQAARKLEAMFERHWPITYKAFAENGRAAP